MDKFLKFFPLVKVDEAQRMVYGVVAEETLDSDGEVWDYESGKPQYQATAEKLGKVSDGENIMPLREMHQLKAVGAGKSIDFDDARKQVRMAFKVVDDSTWKKVCEKVLLGFSHGGKYLRRWNEAGKSYYTATAGEVSLVDHPAMPNAFIEVVKADGSVEQFKTPAVELTQDDINRIAKALETSLAQKGVKYLVPGTTHLPYTDESGKPSHSHMGAAWAALHGGYRGNKYEGPGKEQAIARLKELYHSEGMEPPSSKSILDELSKLEFLGDSELDTEMRKISSLVADLMAKQSATGASMKMTTEQLKKAADALGMQPDEFAKLIGETVVGDELQKAKKGLAALHAHMESAMEHHEKMSKAHSALGDMHAEHAKHLGKCMKACKDVMGSDEKEAEKALKALFDELKPPTVVNNTSVSADTMTKADAEKLIADAVKKAVEALPAPPPAALFSVSRDNDVKKAERVQQNDPLPV